jgi:outer membrane lipoprotein carrier protein
MKTKKRHQEDQYGAKASEPWSFKTKPSFSAFALFVYTLLLLAACCFQWGASVSYAAGLEDSVDKIQKAYDEVVDVRGNFVQKNTIKELKHTYTYKGSFYIKSPKIRWEFTGEKAQTVYIDKEHIIIYQKKEKQVFKSKFDKATYGQTPLAFLMGLGNIREEFDAASGPGNTIVLKPKKSMGSITRIEIKPAQGAFPIKAITIIDKLSNITNITLSDVRVNTGLKDSLFRFTPPKGVAIMEN